MSTRSRSNEKSDKNADDSSCCRGQAGRQDSSLEGKKARVTGRERSWVKPAMITGSLVLAAAIIVVLMGSNPEKPMTSKAEPIRPQAAQATTSTTSPAVTGQPGVVRVPLPAADDRKAHFHQYSAKGKTVSFFVLRASDGTVRAAFDACTACYHAKRGYRQDGDNMICNNCGMRFQSIKIGVLTGGCNPIPIKSIPEQGAVVLSVRDLEAGAKYF